MSDNFVLQNTKTGNQVEFNFEEVDFVLQNTKTGNQVEFNFEEVEHSTPINT